jgi:hypothetical protein
MPASVRPVVFEPYLLRLNPINIDFAVAKSSCALPGRTAINNKTPRISVCLNSDVAGYPQKYRRQKVTAAECCRMTQVMQSRVPKTKPRPAPAIKLSNTGFINARKRRPERLRQRQQSVCPNRVVQSLRRSHR